MVAKISHLVRVEEVEISINILRTK